MLIPGQNQLAEPAIVKVEDFEALLAEFKAFVVEYVAVKDPTSAAKLEVSLANESELITLILEAFTHRLQTQERSYNAKIKQMLAWWATGTNLDARLADVGLERLTLDEGDANAYPVVPPTMESDDAARLRYYLAPHAPAAGSRMQYRREILTLGGRADVSVDTSESGKVVVTYTFDDDGWAAKIKDGNARCLTPGSGRVTVTVLGREGDGTPGADLLAAVASHFGRDDVRPETDQVIVQAATIKTYKIRAVAYINPGPDASLTESAAETALQSYADSCHRLETRVEPSWIDYTLHNAGAVRLELLEPVAPIVCAYNEAPYCTGVEIEVRTL
nr:baseplate J/gp47 family protein [Pseudomonas zeshuii]